MAPMNIKGKTHVCIYDYTRVSCEKNLFKGKTIAVHICMWSHSQLADRNRIVMLPSGSQNVCCLKKFHLYSL